MFQQERQISEIQVFHADDGIPYYSLAENSIEDNHV